MNDGEEWQKYWDTRAATASSDHNFDRGTMPREALLEQLSRQELLEFIDPQAHESVFDAGCGTGSLMVELRPRVRSLAGIDFSAGAIARCQKRLKEAGFTDVQADQGSVTQIPVASTSCDKILCLSVLQYLDDESVRQALGEFARILKPGGHLILHVKNLSSLYLTTLQAAKKLKRLIGRPTKIEHIRTFSWYLHELKVAGFSLVTYNSFNLLVIDGMPRAIQHRLQTFELKHYGHWLLRAPWMGRLGADLKLKAKRL